MSAADEQLGLVYVPMGMAAIDQWGGRRTPDTVWQHRNGTTRDQVPVPVPFKMGVPSLGDPIVTAGGVAFLGSALDYYLRAYDVTTGDVLWRGRLPAGGQATPMSYWSNASGRQFVVIAADGHGTLGTASSPLRCPGASEARGAFGAGGRGATGARTERPGGRGGYAGAANAGVTLDSRCTSELGYNPADGDTHAFPRRARPILTPSSISTRWQGSRAVRSTSSSLGGADDC